MSRNHQIALAAAMAAGYLGSASAASPFEGRLANGEPSSTCTVTGVNKCAMFFDSTLDITILNNWNIATGVWSATADAGSAQWFAALAGRLGSNFETGWVLPTGDRSQAAGALNQYLSIWDDVGGSFDGLSGQFDGVQAGAYWSGTANVLSPGNAWFFVSQGAYQSHTSVDEAWYAVAVRPGDVAAAVPEPQRYAMLLAGLGMLVMVVRRRPRQGSGAPASAAPLAAARRAAHSG